MAGMLIPDSVTVSGPERGRAGRMSAPVGPRGGGQPAGGTCYAATYIDAGGQGSGRTVNPTQADTPAGPGRVRTIPNMISLARLLGVPLFLYLFLGPHADAVGMAILVVGGTSDWVDGYVARRLRQVSRLGELLDPLADRLYIFATVVAFTLRDVLPWQFTAALVLREAVLAVALGVLRRHGYGPPPVHYLGKTATFILLAAFPTLLLGSAVPVTAPVAVPLGWAFAWWGIVLYWVAAALYLAQTAALVRSARERDAHARARERDAHARSARDTSPRGGHG